MKRLWAGILCGLLLCVSRLALAGQPVRDAEHEARYYADLQLVDAKLVEQFKAGTAALDEGRPREARAAFESILAAVPDHTPTMRRLAYALSTIGDKYEALQMARKAYALDTEDLGSLSVLATVLADQGVPSSAEEAVRLAKRLLVREPSADAAGLLAHCALAANDMGAFENAADELASLAPELPDTHVVLAINYARKEDMAAAEREIDAAVAAGLPRERADKLSENLGVSENRRHWLYAKIAGIVLGAWLVLMGLVFLSGLVLSRLTLAEIERNAGTPERLAHNTRSLRKAYAVAIGISAFYYFVSIPVLIAVVLVGAGALLYGIFMLGRIPIKLVVVIIIGALVTVWAMLKSLFIRRGPLEDPGRKLRENEAPGLWTLLREVAQKVGTRPVDKVFLTVGTELAVIERGKLSARLRDRGERLLLLGAGVLGGLSVHQLRAILAHEYGHFSNRDTAGGDVAMTVNASLFSTAKTLAESGVSPLNPTWQFLRIFSSIFARITRGASRLQEVMADQFAALAYGAPAFCSGLEMVIRRGVHFDAEVEKLVKKAESDKQAIHNLYTPPALEEGQTRELEAALQEALNAPASAYDSHPPPQRRMEWVRKLPPASVPDDQDAPAWSLFRDPDKLQSLLTEEVNERLRDQGLIGPAPTAWPQATQQ